MAGIEGVAAGLEGKEIEAIHVEVHPIEEGIQIAGIDPFAKHLDVELGIDLPGHLDHDVDLGTA